MEPHLIAVDSSVNYMKMCKGAEVIQKIKRNEETGNQIFYTGDWYVIDHPKRGLCIDNISVTQGFVTMRDSKPVIWLPTMSQLKELFGAGGEAILIFIAITNHWRSDAPYLVHIDHSSAEQLMLAWLMRKKYGKKWTGNEWVKDVSKNVDEKRGESYVG
ncbi:hypothetical protein ACFVS2_25905 [Brevibacillus sp. NPDC058079]|uniref:hypothetical protein n=1 Tax=Brevibacillus sp. NPDC058079 TaxID=3346330 RepID=UPI0036ED0421